MSHVDDLKSCREPDKLAGIFGDEYRQRKKAPKSAFEQRPNVRLILRQRRSGPKSPSQPIPFGTPDAMTSGSMNRPGGEIRIGISGWRYPGWRKVFYPPGLAQRRELEYAAASFNTIELNGSFYSLQRPEFYADWADATPSGFLFAVKGGRYITHMKRLRDLDAPLANFFGSGLLRLGRKLGPFLWQFPPNMKFEIDRFEEFFRMLPRDGQSAVATARKHDHRLEGRSWLKADDVGILRHAVEVRHESFQCPEFISLLRQHDIALVVADTAGHFPYMEDVTADFVYIRLHGAEEIYASGYTEEALDRWAERIRQWSAGKQPADAVRLAPKGPRKSGRDVFVYFDNDAKVHAPFDALKLCSRLGLHTASQLEDAEPPTAKR